MAHDQALWDGMLLRTDTAIDLLIKTRDNCEALMRSEASMAETVVGDITSLYKITAGLLAFYQFKRSEVLFYMKVSAEGK